MVSNGKRPYYLITLTKSSLKVKQNQFCSYKLCKFRFYEQKCIIQQFSCLVKLTAYWPFQFLARPYTKVCICPD